MMIILIVGLLMSLNNFIIAVEQPNVKYYEKGSIIPYSGFLYSIEYNTQVTKDISELLILKEKYHILDYLESETKTIEKLTNNIEENVYKLVKENTQLSKRLETSLKMNLCNIIIIGVLALVIVALGSYIAVKITLSIPT